MSRLAWDRPKLPKTWAEPRLVCVVWKGLIIPFHDGKVLKISQDINATFS